MKRIFSLTHAKIKPARLVDAAKHDVKKFMKKERSKPLSQGVDYWDFDVKFGLDEAQATSIHPGEINKAMDEAEKSGAESFFIELKVKPGVRSFTPVEDINDIEPSFIDEEVSGNEEQN